jgi:hypothetical protein
VKKRNLPCSNSSALSFCERNQKQLLSGINPTGIIIYARIKNWIVESSSLGTRRTALTHEGVHSKLNKSHYTLYIFL